MSGTSDDCPLSADEIRRIARLVHENYLVRQQASGEFDPQRSAHRPWDQLSPADMKTNINQVRNHARGLATIGVQIVAQDDAATPVESFTDDEMVRLGRWEHNRWATDKLDQGYVWGPERNPDAVPPTHPNLVPWEDLSAEDQDKDFDVWRDVARLYAEAGFHLVRT